MTEGSSVKGVSQRQRVNECKSRSGLTISVRLNHAQSENNRSSFGTFSGPILMLNWQAAAGRMDGIRGPDLARGPVFDDPCLTRTHTLPQKVENKQYHSDKKS